MISRDRLSLLGRPFAVRLLIPASATLLAAMALPLTGQSSSAAQSSTNGSSSAQNQGQAQAESLLLGPGDVVSIHVFGEPELSEPLRVSDAGDITEPFVGKVHVAGLTPSQVAAALEQQFVAQQYLLEPRITVTVEQYFTENIAVVGHVKSVGTYAAPTGRTITEVIAQAGGLLDTADRHVVIRRHADGREIPFFFSNSPDVLLGDQPIVYPGDTVFVPKAGTVYMMGDVPRAGGYVMNNDHSQLTALQLLALAGGANNTSRPSRARLVRHGADGAPHEVELALDEMRKGLAPDVPLLADDIVYVPFSYLKNIAVSLPAIVASAASAAVYVIRQ